MVKFEKNDFKRWTTFRMEKKQYLSRAEFEMVCYLHSKYYRHSYYLPCTCSPKIINQWINDLNKIWDSGD
tara:strand:+ start:111 stop:320 length:210 start_codon:yes stop_codon:yes gene_type:complete